MHPELRQNDIPTGLRILRSLVMVLLLVEGILLEAGILTYLPEQPTGLLAVAVGVILLVPLVLTWSIPRFVRPRGAAVLLLLVTALAVGPPASATWPGGITLARFGWTVIGAFPVPVFDLRITAGGLVWFRKKTHRVTRKEVAVLLEPDLEVLIIGNGWNGAAAVDDEVRNLPGIRVEILKTPEAVDLYNRLRREGRRVAILLHSTC